MQPRQQAAEGSQGGTGTEMPVAQAANETGQAIVQRADRRLGPTPGVIPLDVSQHLAARVARLALARLPLLESIQRRWGPSAGASWGNWPQLLYLQRESGVAAPAHWAGEASPGWDGRLSSPTRNSLPVVSAGPIANAGVRAAAAGPSTIVMPAREPPDAVTDSTAAGAARAGATTPQALEPTGKDLLPRPTPAVTAAVTAQGPTAAIQASTAAPGSLRVVRGSRAPTATPRAIARDVAPAATTPQAVAMLHQSPEHLHGSTVTTSPAPAASPPDATTPSAVSSPSLVGASRGLPDHLAAASRATPAAFPVVRPAPRATQGQRSPEPSAAEAAPVATPGPAPSSARSTGLPAPLASRPGPGGPQPQPGVIARWGEPIVQRPRAGRPSVQPAASSAIPSAFPGPAERVVPGGDQNPAAASTSWLVGANTPAATTGAATAASTATPVVQALRRPGAEHSGPVGLDAGGVPAPGQAQPSVTGETAPVAAPAPAAASTVMPVVQVSRRPVVDFPGPIALAAGGAPARVPASGQAQPSGAGETAPAAADVLSRAPADSQAQKIGTPAVEGRATPVAVAHRTAPTPGMQALTVPDGAGLAFPPAGHPPRVVSGHALARHSHREHSAPTAGYSRGGTSAGQPRQPPGSSMAWRSAAPASEPHLAAAGEPASQGAPAVAGPTPAVVVRPSNPPPWVVQKAAGAAQSWPAVTHLPATAIPIITASRPLLGDKNVPGTSGGIAVPGSAPDLLRALDLPTEPPLVVPAWPAIGDQPATGPHGASDVPAAVNFSSEPGFSWRGPARRGARGNAAAEAPSAPTHVTASPLPVVIQRQANSAPPSPASAPPAGPSAASAPEPASTTTKSLRLEDMDLERVARAVYDLLEQRLQIERECRGL